MNVLFSSCLFIQYNFVGKLLGPKGSTLKQLQLDTGTRMSILGRNSIRDKAKVGTRMWPTRTYTQICCALLLCSLKSLYEVHRGMKLRG